MVQHRLEPLLLAGAFRHRSYIPQNLQGLLLDGAEQLFPGFRIHGQLAGYKDQIVVQPGLGVMAGRLRGFVGSDLLHFRLPSS